MENLMKIVRALFKAVARVVRQFPAMAGWAIAAYKCSAPNLGHYMKAFSAGNSTDLILGK